MNEVEHIDIKPQDGSQHEFLASGAVEVFMGGEAGGGKSFGLLLDPLEDIESPHLNAIIFRRTFPDLEELIHDAHELYVPFGATWKDQGKVFTFPEGGRVRFSHMQHPQKDVHSHQGKQYTHIYFDELPHFPKFAYTYLFSRLRSAKFDGFKRIRSTGNPDGEGVLWVKERFVDTLKPFEVGSFVMRNNKDIRVEKGTTESVTRQFIPCYRKENIALMAKDPDYESMLNMLPEAQKRALKFGIWENLDIPNQIVKSSWWDRATSGEVEITEGRKAFGLDYAELGSDSSVMTFGYGNQVYKVEEFPYLSHAAMAAKVNEIFTREGKYQLYGGIDSVGTGAGVYTNCCDLYKLGDRLNPIRYKDRSFEEEAHRKGLKMKFNNLRSMMWYHFSKSMENGEIDLSLLNTESNYYDNIGTMKQEVLAHTYEVRNGVYQVISKNELRKPNSLGRSPDRADSLVIWWWVHRDKPQITNAPGFDPDDSYFEEESDEDVGDGYI